MFTEEPKILKQEEREINNKIILRIGK
jgi:hypothetical protein